MSEKYDPDCLHCQVAKLIHDRGGFVTAHEAGQAITYLTQVIGEIVDSFPADRDHLARTAFHKLGEELHTSVREVGDERVGLH